MTIDTLSDDALLYVFDFYVAQASGVETWHTLVHVCQRWRDIVFRSPRRLNLRIDCRSLSLYPLRLDVWPALPIVISDDVTPFLWKRFRPKKHQSRTRVQRTCISNWSSIMGEMMDCLDVFTALEKPFPALTDLTLLVKEPSDPMQSFLIQSSSLVALPIYSTSRFR